MTAQLRVVETPPGPEPPDYEGIYSRLIREQLMTTDDSKDWTKRFVYLAVKGAPIIFDYVVTPTAWRSVSTGRIGHDSMGFYRDGAEGDG